MQYATIQVNIWFFCHIYAQNFCSTERHDHKNKKLTDNISHHSGVIQEIDYTPKSESPTSH